jgi:hypothetical protein
VQSRVRQCSAFDRFDLFITSGFEVFVIFLSTVIMAVLCCAMLCSAVQCSAVLRCLDSVQRSKAEYGTT